MNTNLKRVICYATLIITTGLIASQSSAQFIDPDNSFAYGENIGFLNFADAGDPAGSEEVFAASDFLEGYIWSENTGWIHLGAGAGPYSNTSGLDYGVNRDQGTGELSGFAWGENIGWVNLSGGSLASPPNPARIESGRFKGYAWSENAGWINLDDDEVFVGLANCAVDLNNDGQLDFFDVSAFLSAFNAMDPSADFSPDGMFDFFDVSAFLNAFSMGCP